MQKKPKKDKPRLIKVSNIECLNGNAIIIGQLRRNDVSDPILWEYTVINPSGETLKTSQHTDKHKAFDEAMKIACPNTYNKKA